MLLSYVHKNRHIALATASSGIAVTLLRMGCTAHSRFETPIPATSTSTCNVSPNDATGCLLHDAKLIVFDEAPMSHRHLFEALDRTLKDIMNNNLIFGGKLLILGGDFRQILPVIRRAQRPALTGACLKKSEIWNRCEVFHLTINMRVQNCIINNDIISHTGLTTLIGYYNLAKEKFIFLKNFNTMTQLKLLQTYELKVKKNDFTCF